MISLQTPLPRCCAHAPADTDMLASPAAQLFSWAVCLVMLHCAPAEKMQTAGYATHFVGKWHNGYASKFQMPQGTASSACKRLHAYIVCICGMPSPGAVNPVPVPSRQYLCNDLQTCSVLQRCASLSG